MDRDNINSYTGRCFAHFIFERVVSNHDEFLIIKDSPQTFTEKRVNRETVTWYLKSRYDVIVQDHHRHVIAKNYIGGKQDD